MLMARGLYRSIKSVRCGDVTGKGVCIDAMRKTVIIEEIEKAEE
jgi:hypothetical protein